MKRSTIIPLLMLGYLAVMSYIGFDEYRNGHYLYYFGIIGATLVTIYLLHLSLKKRERIRAEREKSERENDNETAE